MFLSSLARIRSPTTIVPRVALRLRGVASSMPRLTTSASMPTPSVLRRPLLPARLAPLPRRSRVDVGLAPSTSPWSLASGRIVSTALRGTSDPTSSPTATAPPLSSENYPSHVPVLLREVLEAFSPLPKIDLYVDGTLGAGGHASAVVRRFSGKLRAVVGLDVDAAARELARRNLEEAVSDAASTTGSPVAVRVVDSNFRDMRRALEAVAGDLNASPKSIKASAILLDLGVSSMQLDSPSRGFSFAADGPLDMRLDGGGTGGGARRGSEDFAGVTAATIVNGWPEEDLASLFASRDYGGERHAKLAARRIVRAREEKLSKTGRGIETTRELAVAVGRLGPPPAKRSGTVHPATRVFQALRLAVNDELGALEEALPAAIDLLEPGGRLAVISFHSGEDRAVKRAFAAAAGRPVMSDDGGGLERTRKPGGSVSSRAALSLAPPPPPPPAVARLVNRKPIVAGEDECASNPRARSAKLRVLEKL